MADSGEMNSIPRPARAAYKESPYESPARVGNGTGGESPFHDTPEETPPRAPKPLAFSMDDEQPKTSNDALIGAVKKIHAVVTDRIAYHEREARRLRESLAPFAAVGRQADGGETTAENAIKAILNLADRMPPTGEQTP